MTTPLTETELSKQKKKPAEFVLFDVEYEDGSRSSNRRVDRDITESLDKDAAVKAAIEEQDRIIAERARRPPAAIKAIQVSRKARKT
jgi:uncharacterized protein YdaU (DUF1376 family)